MKKVLIVSDGANFSEGAFEFARQLNEKDPVLLTGVFVPQMDYANLWSYAVAAAGPMFVPVYNDQESDDTKNSIRQFTELCRRNGMEYRVHSDYGNFTLPELRKETRYADLLIIGNETFYKQYGTKQPNEYLRDILHETECPIVIVPEQYTFPEKNILAYDGSPASVYAIKQFAYLLPTLCSNETMLVTAGTEGEDDFPDAGYIKELACRHYSSLNLFSLQADARKYFSTWVAQQKGAILVAGSYSRPALSEIFRRSFVSEVLKDHWLPVFIAHH